LVAPGGGAGRADAASADPLPEPPEPVPEPLAGSGAALAAGGPTGALDPGLATLASCGAGGVAGARVFAALEAGDVAASLPPAPISPILNAP
jgi:hypothetical protein